MEGRLGVMIDMEEALFKLEGKNLYSAGLAFFSALGYPVQPLEIAINESMSRFVYIISNNRCIFSREETDVIKNVSSISWLFTLSHIQETRNDDIQISPINYFCAELDCTLHDRSIQAFILTRVINKVVNTPVVVLLKHVNHLLLSSIFMLNGDNNSVSKIYLSDWHLFKPIQEDVLMILSNWYLGNYCNDNIYIFFMDWVHSMARHYFLNFECYEYVKYECTALFSQPNPEEIKIDGICYPCPIELEEYIIKQEPRDYYGYDYVNNEESIEILIDDNDWIMDELYYLEEMERMIGEAALSDDDEDDYSDDDGEFDSEIHIASYQKDISGLSIDINCIDVVIFKDPIKMLEYLESLDRK